MNRSRVPVSMLRSFPKQCATYIVLHRTNRSKLPSTSAATSLHALACCYAETRCAGHCSSHTMASVGFFHAKENSMFWTSMTEKMQSPLIILKSPTWRRASLRIFHPPPPFHLHDSSTKNKSLCSLPSCNKFRGGGGYCNNAPKSM